MDPMGMLPMFHRYFFEIALGAGQNHLVVLGNADGVLGRNLFRSQDAVHLGPAENDISLNGLLHGDLYLDRALGTKP